MSYSPARLENAPRPEQPAATSPEPSEAPAPSWFPTTSLDPAQSEQLMQRYRERMAREQSAQKQQAEDLEDYRRKLDEKFKAAQRLYDPPKAPAPLEGKAPAAAAAAAPAPTAEVTARVRRPTLPRQTLNDMASHMPQQKPRSAPPPRRSTGGLGLYAAYAAIAIVIGGAAGYGFANRATLVAFSAPSFAQLQESVAGLTKPLSDNLGGSGGSVMSKKTITMASLSVNDVTGTLNSMIPLTLSATPADAARPVDVVISGLPSAAYLTAGEHTADGNWLVKAPDMANLRLVVPQSETPKIDLQVAAVEPTSGALASPAQKLQVALSDVQITPVSAAPDEAGGNVTVKPAEVTDVPGPTPSAVPPPIAASGPGADLVAKADALMNQGDILSARQLYLQAAAAGNAKGAFGVARSYDPKVFAALKIEGLQPDAAKAADWYKKAQSAGITASQ